MSANLDRSLDEVISTRRTNTHRGRGRGRGGYRGGGHGGYAKATLVGARPPRSVAPGPVVPASSGPVAAVLPSVAEKIIVSNLPTDVNEAQVRELFTTMIGPLRDVSLTYDARGVSKGIASVIFVRKGDAARAYEQYHDRLIDGRNPMKIEIVVDPRKTAGSTPLSARVSNPVAATNSLIPGPGTGNFRGGFRGGRGRGRGRGGRRQDDRPKKTVEDLDAEMEDYTQAAPETTAASS